MEPRRLGRMNARAGHLQPSTERAASSSRSSSTSIVDQHLPDGLGLDLLRPTRSRRSVVVTATVYRRHAGGAEPPPSRSSPGTATESSSRSSRAAGQAAARPRLRDLRGDPRHSRPGPPGRRVDADREREPSLAYCWPPAAPASVPDDARSCDSSTSASGCAGAGTRQRDRALCKGARRRGRLRILGLRCRCRRREHALLVRVADPSDRIALGGS
jgi:hypothetical protein